MSEEQPVKAVEFQPARSALTYADASTLRPGQFGITRGDIATLAIRVLGIYVLFQILGLLVYLIQFAFVPYGITSNPALGYLVLSAVVAAIGVLMIVKAGWIGERMLPKSFTPDAAPAPGSPVELQAAAFAVIGVLVFTWAIPELAFAIMEAGMPSTHFSGVQWMTFAIKPLVELALGVWLFFGSKRLALFWARLRMRDRALDPDSGPL